MSTQLKASKRVFPEGLIGRKVGMTSIFDGNGVRIPVTVVQVGPCVVLGVKNQSKDGYSAVQVGFKPKDSRKLNKADLGHFNKCNAGAFEYVKELRCDVEKLGWNEAGKELKVSEVFAAGELVDVSGTSIGRGFAGVFKRHHAGGMPSTRGTHEYRRHIGSVGCRKWPGRIHPGKRMPGHMGAERVTIQNLEVVSIDAEDNLLLIKGGIPGADGGIVEVRKAVKGYRTPKGLGKAA